MPYTTTESTNITKGEPNLITLNNKVALCSCGSQTSYVPGPGMSSGWRFHRKPFVNLIKGGFTHFESGWLPYRRNTWQENLVFEYQLTCIEPKMYFANFFVCSEKQWHLPTPPLQKNFHTKSRDHYVHHKVSGSHPARREMIPGLAWPSNTKQVVCKNQG